MSDRAGAARWLTIHDELLRGVAHALSNRVATISVASYMLQVDGADVAHQATVLGGETERLEELLLALRLLPRSDEAVAEPIIASDIVRGALGLHAHHGDLRAVPCDVRIDPDTAPAFADPLALQHALLVALTAARRAAGPAGRAHLQVDSTADVVRFAAYADTAVLPADDDGAADADAVEWLLGAHGGQATPHPAGCSLTVPTLMAARRPS